MLHFHTSSERIARVASCIEPYFSLQIHAKPELAHRLQTSRMRHNDIVTVESLGGAEEHR